MEWGIKLKNNDKNDTQKLLKKTYLDFIIKSIIYFVIVIVLYIVIAEILSLMDFQWIYDRNPNLYSFITEIYSKVFLYPYSFIIPTFIIIVGFWVLLYKLFKKYFSYLSALSESSDKLFDKNVEYITLPEELSDLEKKLNHFKRESIKNERLARENEQKKDELIVYLAHDIKTPLTSMIGYLSLLDEIDDMPEEKRKKYIGIALDKSYRLEDLINELFDVARFNSEKIILEKEELNLNLMLEQIIDDFYPVLNEKNKKINSKLDEKIMLYADPDKLSRVFSNLIKNAINYSKEDSDIDIDVSKTEDNVIVKVKNNGKQIPKEKLDRIFEKFYRLDSSRTSKTGGSGLGLAIAKEIVELHNGNISAESNMEETIFTIELPTNIN